MALGRTVQLLPTGANTAFVIYDETGLANIGFARAKPDACNGGFMPKRNAQFQNTPLFRGAFPFMADRLNVWTSWSFTVEHFFASYQLCQQFAAQRIYLPRSGKLQITNSASGSSFAMSYPSAFLTEVESVKEMGVMCVFRYQIAANSIPVNSL